MLHLARREEANTHALRQAELSREIGDRRSEALGLGAAGIAAIDRGRLSEALSLASRAVELTEAIRDPRGICISIGNLASVHIQLGDLKGARSMLILALQLSGDLKVGLAEAAHLLRLGLLDEAEGDPAAALEAARAAAALVHAAGDSEGRAVAVMQQLGRDDEAIAALDEAMSLAAALDVPSALVMATLQSSATPAARRRRVSKSIPLTTRGLASMRLPHDGCVMFPGRRHGRRRRPAIGGSIHEAREAVPGFAGAP